jgi:hypothetical protein
MEVLDLIEQEKRRVSTRGRLGPGPDPIPGARQRGLGIVAGSFRRASSVLRQAV